MADGSDQLRLTDFMDLAALQEMQDAFSSIAGVKAVITDAAGTRLTSPDPTTSFLHRQAALAKQEDEVPAAQRVGREYVAPIVVDNQRLGMIRMRGGSDSTALDDDKAQRLAKRFGLEPQTVRELVAAATKDRNRRPAAVQFLFLLANAIARMCFQEYQLNQRVAELTTISRVAVMLAEAHDLQRVLDRTVETVTALVGARACSIRLVDQEQDELAIKAVYNLSREYLAKGKISLSRSVIDHSALSDKGYEYVANMAQDPRVLYPEESRREGIVSMLSVGMRYQGQAIGVIHVYTAGQRAFSQTEIELLKTIAATAASAIENARLSEAKVEAEKIERQINMAADVQQRLIPRTPPVVKGLDLAALYVPCYQLGGDLYDLIPLPDDNLGIAIADVSGKGVPASLIMASVRGALRAQVDNVYGLDEVVRRLNAMLCRDSHQSEFVTLFYGVIDMRRMRMTYCNAGHLPVMLLRGQEIIEIGGRGTSSMALGIDANEPYAQHIIELRRQDTLVFYTDGLSEARNYEEQMYGRPRIMESLRKGGPSAGTVARNLLWDLRRFAGYAKSTDDITIVTARLT